MSQKVRTALAWSAENGVQRWTSEHGELVLLRPRPWVEQTVLRGHISAAHVEALIAAHERELHPAARFHSFSDLWEVTGYDIGARLAVTGWSVQNRPRIVSYNSLIHSPVVYTAMTFVSVLAGGAIRTWRHRAGYEDALQRALAAPPFPERL